MPKTIKDSNLHEIVTIRKILEEFVVSIREIETLPVVGNEYKLATEADIDTALAEIREILKECEPSPFTSHLDIRLRGHDADVNTHGFGILTDREEQIYGYGGNDTIKEYTANIEKRLG